MSNERSDDAYRIWRDAAERFDYYVTGGAAAVTAYLGQGLRPVRIGPNAATLELAALALFASATVCGIKRIEHSINVFRLQHRRLHAEAAAGARVTASQYPASVNVDTGEIATADQHAHAAREFVKAAASIRPSLDRAISRATWYYTARNRTLLAGFLLLVVSRILPAYMG